MNAPYLLRNIGMLKFNYPEDYTGHNLNHRIVNEKRKLTDPTSRVITLDYGAFFADSVVVRNLSTGRPLVKGIDYACVELDTLATERSGKQVCTTILVTNEQADQVAIDYMFVGGQHMTGLHLIKETKNIFPNGLNPKYDWDHTLNKPETFKSKSHTTHVNELYGFDGLTKSLDDIIQSLDFKDERQVNAIFSKVMAKINELDVGLNQFILEMDASVNKAFEDFRVQDNEYIFTATPENPAIKRGYGTWTLVSDTILKADNNQDTYVISANAVIALGSNQIVKNCYVWKNQSGANTPTFAITSPVHSGLPATQRNENADITFNIATTNLAVGTKVLWAIIDKSTKEPVTTGMLSTPSVGEALLDANGRASVTVKFLPNTNTANQNRDYSFRLIKTNTAYFDFTVIDSSLEKRIETKFTLDAQGLKPITKVEEAQEFFLQVKYIGNWQAGEVAILDWGASGINVARILSGNNPAPKTLLVPSSPTETFSLKVTANSLIDFKQNIVVYALTGLDKRISSTANYAKLEVVNSSKFKYASISFNDVTKSKNKVGYVDEDTQFNIVIETNLINTELKLAYNSTKQMNGFTGLVAGVLTDASGRAVVNAKVLADFITNIGAQSLTVFVESDGVTIGQNTLFIADTSTGLDYTVFFSKANIAELVSEVNEGDKFYLNIKVYGWINGNVGPSLDLKYTLNELATTTDADVKARINSSLYSSMLFAQSSNAFNEVTWVNGNTLRFEFTAIADNTINGDFKFGVSVKQSNKQTFDTTAYLTIRDTSVPDVTGTWSSSALTLTPITSIDEMTNDGLTQSAYLWLDFEALRNTPLNITLSSNATPGGSNVTLFPSTMTVGGSGNTRVVVAVNTGADFLTEGNQELFVAGTFLNDRGQSVELFRSTITLVDNSVQTAISAQLSTDPVQVIAATAFSEWKAFYAHLSYPSFAFDSEIEWRAEFTSNPGAVAQLVNTSGVLNVPMYTAGQVLTLTPVMDRNQDGEAIFTLYYRRKISGTGQYISAEQSIPNIKILDDAVAADLIFKIYSDAARTTEIGDFVSEGTKLYLRAIINNPDRNYAVCFGIKDNVSGVALTSAGTSVNVLTSSSIPDKILIDNLKIVSNIVAVQGQGNVNVDAEITVVADRTSLAVGATHPDGIGIEARLYDNSANAYPLNTVVPFASVPKSKSSRTFGINDTSKTAAYSIVAPATVNEDASLRLELAITDGTVGDVYYPTLLSVFDTTRFGVNELGLEQLAAVSNSSLFWNFKVSPDFKTTGNINLQFGFINKTTGVQVATKTVVLVDTSTEPSLDVTTGRDGDVTWVTVPIPEGDNMVLRVASSNNQLAVGETIKIEWVSGRAANEFTGLFGEFVTTLIPNGSNAYLQKAFSLAKDHKTNSAEENSVTIKVTAMNSGTVKNVTFNIVDTSQTPAIKSAVWKSVATGEVVTFVNEGDTVKLEVQAYGGTDPYNLTLTNNGGRSIGRLDTSDYGVTKLRSSDYETLAWTFKIKADGLNNTSNESLLSVQLTSDVGTINSTYTLPIADTSRATAATISFKRDTDNSIVPLIGEGAGFSVTFAVTGIDPTANYRLLTKSARPVNDGWLIDVTKLGSVLANLTASTGNYIASGLFTTADNKLNTNPELEIDAELWDTTNNYLVASNKLTIADISRPTISSSLIRICAKDGTTHLANTNEGVTLDLYVLPAAFNDIDWAKENVKVVLNTNLTLSTKVFSISQLTLQPDGSYRVSFSIPANEITAAGEQSIIAELFQSFATIWVTGEYSRGVSAKTVVNDTSPLPSIDRVYTTKSQSSTMEPYTLFSEGENMFVHVWATGLTADGSSTFIDLTWDGTASEADFSVPRPIKVRMDLVDANTRQYFGTTSSMVIVQELAEG